MPASERRYQLRFLVHVTVLVLALGCLSKDAGDSGAAHGWVDPAAHVNAFVSVNGARLNYLDWGGSRFPLIFLHGMSDNAHAFDDLAALLAPHFRVVAYTRRGHGRSSKEGPYDTSTLAEDLRVLMDSLGIKKAHLAGWSFGGNEITAFAGRYADRVGRLVYLDAGYDFADPAMERVYADFPLDYSPPPRALASLDGFRRWQLETRAVSPAIRDTLHLDAYIRDQVEVSPTGVHIQARDSILGAIGEAASRREYQRLTVPILAIYAATYNDTLQADSSLRIRAAAWERAKMAPWRTASLERLRQEARAPVQVLTVAGSHHNFLFVSTQQVADAMLAFLRQ